jgi:hypothetical protein
MNRLTGPIVFLVLMLGCSHMRHFSNYDEINYNAKGRKVKVELSNGSYILSKDVQITSDSTFWIEPHEGIRNGIATSKVHKIAVFKHARGAWEGFRPFLFAGVTLGLIAAATTDKDDLMFNNPGGNFIMGTAMGVLPGVVLGIPIGAIVGSKDVYIINPCLQEEKQQLGDP